MNNETSEIKPTNAPAGETGAVAWLKRHKSWLGFIGAAIVFLTFVVKEGAKEDAKEARDALDTALRDLASRSDFDRVMQELHPFYVSWQYHAADVSIDPNFKKELDTGLIAENAERKAGVLLALAKTFPKPESTEQSKQLGELKVVFKNLKDESKPALAGFQDFTINRPHPLPGRVAVDIETFNKKSAKWEQTLAEASPQLANCEHVVMEMADRQKERYESRFEMWKMASYVLYTIGWCLGLLGQIIGVKIGGQGD